MRAQIDAVAVDAVALPLAQIVATDHDFAATTAVRTIEALVLFVQILDRHAATLSALAFSACMAT